MRRIEIDIRGCSTKDDLYGALLSALGAPDWHGRNLDALWDSVASGEVNSVIPPYTLQILGSEAVPEQLLSLLHVIETLFAEARVEGLADVSLLLL